MKHKFKAWNVIEKRLFDVFGFDENHVYGWIRTKEEEKLNAVPPARGECILLPYTGIDDKNGKEAYLFNKIRVFARDRKYQDQEIVFKDGMFCGYNEQKPCRFTSLGVIKRTYDFEIVGWAMESEK